ncbi:unnamed protein product, partial [Mesorhabditis spiculigera]
MNMAPFIVVQANDRVVKVTARKDGTMNKMTLRSAFQLEADVPIGLFKNDLALACTDDDVFELQEGWQGAEFELRWEESRRSRRVTPTEQGATIPKKRKLEPESQELPVDGDLAASIGRYALYYNMGYSILHDKTSHQSLSTGIIVSDVTRRLRYIGSSGSFKGDSGGSCWNENGQLMGMQIEVHNAKSR